MSLRLRVFLGVLCVGLVFIVGALLWALLIQITNDVTPSPPSGADHGAVASAWQGSPVAVQAFPGSEVEADAITMQQRLSVSDYSALVKHAAALMAATPMFDHETRIPAARFDGEPVLQVDGSRYPGMFSSASWTSSALADITGARRHTSSPTSRPPATGRLRLG